MAQFTKSWLDPLILTFPSKTSFAKKLTSWEFRYRFQISSLTKIDRFTHFPKWKVSRSIRVLDKIRMWIQNPHDFSFWVIPLFGIIDKFDTWHDSKWSRSVSIPGESQCGFRILTYPVIPRFRFSDRLDTQPSPYPMFLMNLFIIMFHSELVAVSLISTSRRRWD